MAAPCIADACLVPCQHRNRFKYSRAAHSSSGLSNISNVSISLWSFFLSVCLRLFQSFDKERRSDGWLSCGGICQQLKGPNCPLKDKLKSAVHEFSRCVRSGGCEGSGSPRARTHNGAALWPSGAEEVPANLRRACCARWTSTDSRPDRCTSLINCASI